MLESMRSQAQSWIAKAILGGIALSFILWGVGDYFLGSHVETVAEVDGAPITDVEFAQAYERQVNAYRSMLGKQFSKEMLEKLNVKDTTLQILINRRLMLAEAERLGLAVPEAAIVASVRANPAFQSAQGFDPQRYHILTRNMGYRTPRDYEAALRLDMLVDTLQRTVTDSAIVLDADVRERFRREYEQRVIEALIVDPEAFEKQAEPDTDAIRAWYEAHKDQYRAPLKVELALVDIDPARLAADIEIGEDAIRAYYDEHRDAFVQPEERRASHILIRVPENADEKTRNKARAKAEALLARIQKGEDFAKLAKEFSDDVTAEQGGDLGWFRQGVMVPAFDEAVFSMKEGEVKGPIETPFGFHLIKLTGIRAQGVRPLEEVREEIARKLRAEKAADEAYRLSEDLDDALGREGSLEAAAKSLNLETEHLGPISRKQALLEPKLADAGLLSRVFAARPGDPVEIYETESGHFVAFEVLRRTEPAVQPLDQVVDRVREDAKRAKARELARAKAEEILKTQADDRPLDRLAQATGLAGHVSKPVRADGSGDASSWLTADVLAAAFQAAPGGWLDAVQEVPQGYALVRVREVIAPSDKEFEDKRASIEAEERKARGAVRFARWMASVRSRHDVEIHERQLERF